jgi:hypothetical protein
MCGLSIKLMAALANNASTLMNLRQARQRWPARTIAADLASDVFQYR